MTSLNRASDGRTPFRAGPTALSRALTWAAVARSLPARLRWGLLLLIALVSMAIAADHLYPGDPFATVGEPSVSPGVDGDFPLGTDLLGRDIAAGLVHGARMSLTVGLATTLIATGVGVAVGLAAGYLGRAVDHLLMRITEVFQVIPHFLVSLMLLSIWEPTLPAIVFAISATSWTTIARMVRAEALLLRELDYVRIAAVMGASPLDVIVRHVLPNALPSVIVASSMLGASAILTECGLSFLGLGDSNRISWGSMISASREALLDAPYMALIPGGAIVVTVLALALIGDGLTQLLHPRGHR